MFRECAAAESFQPPGRSDKVRSKRRRSISWLSLVSGRIWALVDCHFSVLRDFGRRSARVTRSLFISLRPISTAGGEPAGANRQSSGEVAARIVAVVAVAIVRSRLRDRISARVAAVGRGLGGSEIVSMNPRTLPAMGARCGAAGGGGAGSVAGLIGPRDGACRGASGRGYVMEAIVLGARHALPLALSMLQRRWARGSRFATGKLGSAANGPLIQFRRRRPGEAAAPRVRLDDLRKARLVLAAARQGAGFASRVITRRSRRTLFVVEIVNRLLRARSRRDDS